MRLDHVSVEKVAGCVDRVSGRAARKSKQDKKGRLGNHKFLLPIRLRAITNSDWKNIMILVTDSRTPYLTIQYLVIPQTNNSDTPDKQ